jgi:predicted nucleic acid-binding protein
MRPVVSDTGPLHYLVLVGAIDVLPRLFGRVLIPEVVASELLYQRTPAAVRAWMQAAPPWFERSALAPASVENPARRGAGERAAIALAQAVGAELLLIDDRAGETAARACGFATIGTLGILLRAAQRELIELDSAFTRLSETNFRARPDLLAALLTQHRNAKTEKP